MKTFLHPHSRNRSTSGLLRASSVVRSILGRACSLEGQDDDALAA